jgi:hypothetical protein
MKYSKLRIAWSVFWSTLVILLIVWWVRSYRVYDTIDSVWPGARGMELGSHFGQFNFEISDPSPELGSHYWIIIHQELDGDEAESLNLPGWFGKIGLRVGGGMYYFSFWFPFIGLMVTAAALWLPLRFTLRKLLIGTALLSVVLGWLVLKARN